MADDAAKAPKKKEKKEKGGKKGKSQKSGSNQNDDKGKGSSKVVNVLDEAAMFNAINICHNVPVRKKQRVLMKLSGLLSRFFKDLLYYRGFVWEGQAKKGKGKARKKKGGKK